jgi:ribosome-associated protein
MADLIIDHETTIPQSELNFRYARSSGPGGQHVQRSETRVELFFDLAHSPSLSEEQRELALARLASRLDSSGVLHLTSQAGRSQLENRLDVTERFRRLLANALRPEKQRKPTRPSAAARRRRLEAKRRHSAAKQRRRPVDSPGEM